MKANWEVEQKFAVDDLQSLRLKLTDLGFELGGTQTNCDTYFRHPSRDFRATDEALRIRSMDDWSCITYKGKRLPGAVKTRPEIELTVAHADRESWLEMFQQLGFTPLPSVNKVRQLYRPLHSSAYGKTKILVVLDEVQSLGSFAEIELVVAEPSELEKASMAVQALARTLGLNTVQPQSYLSLLLAKRELE